MAAVGQVVEHGPTDTDHRWARNVYAGEFASAHSSSMNPLGGDGSD